MTVTGLLALAAVAALALGALPSEAEDEPPPIAAVPLTDRHEFTDDVAAQIRDKPHGRPTEVINLRDASNVTVARITIQPGAMFPWHTHPGPVLGAIAEGDFVYIYADDCGSKTEGGLQWPVTDHGRQAHPPSATGRSGRGR